MKLTVLSLAFFAISAAGNLSAQQTVSSVPVVSQTAEPREDQGAQLAQADSPRENQNDNSSTKHKKNKNEKKKEKRPDPQPDVGRCY